MRSMSSLKVMMALAAGLAVTAAAGPADAFCGFYVNGAGGDMFNDATQVVLMRKGTRTVLSMQNNYKGPPEAFALVIPVPTVLHKEDVKTLPKAVFQRIDTLGAPRLVEYWEEDPCQPEVLEDSVAFAPTGAGIGRGGGGSGEGKFGVTIEAKFEVGEYQIVILSATDSTGLEAWLHAEKYQIPAGAEPYLRPYVDAGSKFFVAKVDAKKVSFDSDGRAALSPLRFHYDTDEFTLPIRLGLVNSGGTQDLIVNILAPGQRYQVANYGNVTIPTNLDVKDEVRTRFGEFYAALFDRTVEKNPGAVVTEYAWVSGSCDPCPGPTLDGGDIMTLGGDVVGGGVSPWDMVLTRLHARYGKTVTEDLVFRAAEPIVGGREFVQADGKLEERARPSSQNNFQARYAIRHEWTGPITCKDPVRGRWGGPPAGQSGGGVAPALNLAFAPRGGLQLPAVVRQDIPEIEVKATGGAALAGAPVEPLAGQTQPPAHTSDPESAQKKKKKTGCGCSAGGTRDAAPLGVLLLLTVALLTRRRARPC